MADSMITREEDQDAIATELRRRGDEALRLAGYEAKKATRGFLNGASAAFHEAADLVASRATLATGGARHG